MYRQKFYVLALLALCMGLVAMPGAVAQEAGACNVEAPMEAVELNALGWSFPILDFYYSEMEACDAVENIDINVNQLSGEDVQEQVNLALSAGGDSPYDILSGANGQVADWGGKGWLMPLNDLIDKYRDEYDLDDISASNWDVGAIDGNIYGIPVIANTLHLFYRSDVLAGMGMMPPETYADVIALCDAIGLDNMDWDAPFGMDLSRPRGWELEFFMVLGGLGGSYLDEGAMPAFNGPEGVQAVEIMLDFFNSCLGEAASSMSNNNMETGMHQGTLPAVKLWASRAAGMSDPDNTELSEVIDFAPAPRVVEGGPRAGSAWLDFFFIPANTTNDPDLIFRVIMEAVDAASQQQAAVFGIPTRGSAADFGGKYLPAASGTVADSVGNYSKHPANDIAIDKLSEFLPLTATGELSPQEALDAAADAYMEEATAQGYIGG
ncbi:MAG: extracellular solute-binding protein [Anaerolineaceae bacterium]|nr:extracellular solute-binding protein [Anaerolineaceae bacterium]MDE0330145.1 extracellular solute-binding protein [Anaerolineaceae bacterium]